MEVIKNNIWYLTNLTKKVVLIRCEWKEMIHVANPIFTSLIYTFCEKEMKTKEIAMGFEIAHLNQIHNTIVLKTHFFTFLEM